MAKKPGVGYRLPPGSTAVWVGRSGVLDNFPINFAATTFEGRYGHPDSFGSPQGFANENHGNNAKALINWYAAQPPAHREQWDGIPTDEWETYDLAFTQSQTGSSFYQQHWWAHEPGGTKETAVVVDESNWTEHGGKFPRGVALGLQTKPGPVEGYPKWYDVRWKPPGFPDPAPPPAVGAAAEFWLQGSGFVLGKVKAVRGTKVKFAPDIGSGSVEHDLDDEGRRWWLKDAPAPTPKPTPTPAPTPAPPKPEPTRPPAVPAPFPASAEKLVADLQEWHRAGTGRGRAVRLFAREFARVQKALLAARGK